MTTTIKTTKSSKTAGDVRRISDSKTAAGVRRRHSREDRILAKWQAAVHLGLVEHARHREAWYDFAEVVIDFAWRGCDRWQTAAAVGLIRTFGMDAADHDTTDDAHFRITWEVACARADVVGGHPMGFARTVVTSIVRGEQPATALAYALAEWTDENTADAVGGLFVVGGTEAFLASYRETAASVAHAEAAE